MANTDKQNFRCNGDDWRLFRQHVEAMQADGYVVDMSMILRAEVERTVRETAKQTAARLGLVSPSGQVKANSRADAETPEHTARRPRKLAAS